jgi:hypothetical protein
MNLTDKAIEHVKNTWTNKKCICCKKNNWEVDGGIFRLYRNDMAAMPLIAVVCINCGNTVFINAIVEKIVDDKGGLQ